MPESAGNENLNPNCLLLRVALARFVVEVIGGFDLRAMTGSYRGSGEASDHPTILLGILIHGYATGVFSSRKLERATYDSVALRFIAANQHPGAMPESG